MACFERSAGRVRRQTGAGGYPPVSRARAPPGGLSCTAPHASMTRSTERRLGARERATRSGVEEPGGQKISGGSHLRSSVVGRHSPPRQSGRSSRHRRLRRSTGTLVPCNVWQRRDRTSAHERSCRGAWQLRRRPPGSGERSPRAPCATRREAGPLDAERIPDEDFGAMGQMAVPGSSAVRVHVARARSSPLQRNMERNGHAQE